MKQRLESLGVHVRNGGMKKGGVGLEVGLCWNMLYCYILRSGMVRYGNGTSG